MTWAAWKRAEVPRFFLPFFFFLAFQQSEKEFLQTQSVGIDVQSSARTFNNSAAVGGKGKTCN